MGSLHYIFGLILCGVAMGVVFDLYNTITGASKWLRWLRPVLDLSFWVLSALVAFYITFVTDDGRYRLYTFGLLLVGYGGYRLTLHERVVGSAFAFVRMVKFILKLVYRTVYVIAIRPLMIIFHIIWVILHTVYRFLCLVENGLFWVMQFWVRMLTWPFKKRLRNLRNHPIISERWEGMWVRVSNWLKKHPERT